MFLVGAYCYCLLGFVLCSFLVLLIHLDDQIDGKTLVGTYVSTVRPGEFRWQPGSLIQVGLFPFRSNIFAVDVQGKS